MAKKFNENYFKVYNYDQKDSDKYIFDIIKTLPEGAKLLDVGCGSGGFLIKIKEIRPDVELYGVDIGDVEGFLDKSINFMKSSGDNINMEGEKFDMITCFHVLEHVLNPHDFISEFHRLVKRGGKLYIECPYYKTIFVPDGQMNFWSDPTHVRPYSILSIQRLFIENKFNFIEYKIFRNRKSILIGPYLIFKYIFLRDINALSTLFAHIYGNAIGGLGIKQ